jgi:hypothetical protein
MTIGPTFWVGAAALAALAFYYFVVEPLLRRRNAARSIKQSLAKSDSPSCEQLYQQFPAKDVAWALSLLVDDPNRRIRMTAVAYLSSSVEYFPLYGQVKSSIFSPFPPHPLSILKDIAAQSLESVVARRRRALEVQIAQKRGRALLPGEMVNIDLDADLRATFNALTRIRDAESRKWLR